jgi:SAM-dependent methyltransferase
MKPISKGDIIRSGEKWNDKILARGAGTKVVFSYNLSKKAYRKIGNTLGAKKRKQDDIASYIERGNLLINLYEKYHAVNENDTLLEIGTGWMHWYSLYTRLFYDVNVTMMDVWDNRQLEALKASFLKLKELSDDLPRRKYPPAIDLILNANSFDELYELFNLSYTIDNEGTLSKFQANSFDVVFSLHVLEHVQKEKTNDLANNIYRILKPGGFSIHQIGIADHLSHYDKKESLMNYLRYSDTTWKIFFQNEVQYFNRLLMSDWINIFAQQGFILMEKIEEYANIDSLKIHPQYQQYAREDLSCIILTVVHQKPK